MQRLLRCHARLLQLPEAIADVDDPRVAALELLDLCLEIVNDICPQDRRVQLLRTIGVREECCLASCPLRERDLGAKPRPRLVGAEILHILLVDLTAQLALNLG